LSLKDFLRPDFNPHEPDANPHPLYAVVSVILPDKLLQSSISPPSSAISMPRADGQDNRMKDNRFQDEIEAWTLPEMFDCGKYDSDEKTCL
jgi:hypothetical protein